METFKNDVIGLTVEYLNKKYDTNIDTQYYANIRTWREWWEGYVKDVHSYIELGVDNAPRMRELYRLGMAKRITEDWASLLLNEKTTIQAEDKTSKTWLFGDDNEQGRAVYLVTAIFGLRVTNFLKKRLPTVQAHL